MWRKLVLSHFKGSGIFLQNCNFSNELYGLWISVYKSLINFKACVIKIKFVVWDIPEDTGIRVLHVMIIWLMFRHAWISLIPSPGSLQLL